MILFRNLYEGESADWPPPPEQVGVSAGHQRILWADIAADDGWDLDAAEADYFPDVHGGGALCGGLSDGVRSSGFYDGVLDSVRVYDAVQCPAKLGSLGTDEDESEDGHATLSASPLSLPRVTAVGRGRAAACQASWAAWLPRPVHRRWRG